MRLIIFILSVIFFTGSFSLFAQNEQVITVCKNSKVFFDNLLDAPINENSNKACIATIRTIKPAYGVTDAGNGYYIFNDINQTYTISSQRAPSSDSDDCDTGSIVEQTVKIVVEDCREESSTSTSKLDFFLDTYRFVQFYVNQIYCEGQEVYRYFVDESGDGNLDNTYLYIVLPDKALLLGKTGTLVCEDDVKDGSCLTRFSTIEEDKRWVCDGCIDPTACNYKEAALEDDSSCFYKDSDCGICSPALGCTNAAARNFNPQANCDDGSCIIDPSVDRIFVDYPVLNSIVDFSNCTNQKITAYKNVSGYLIFEIETALHRVTYDEDGNFICKYETDYEVPCSYNSNVQISQILSTWTCPNRQSIMGCTDATACNYNPKAVVDDSSCFYKSANNNCLGLCYPFPRWAGFGCTDVKATNYSPTSACDDGSCIYEGEPTVFTRYPWLTNYVDLDNCTNEKITVYFDVSGLKGNEIYLETENGTYIFEIEGKERCSPEDELETSESCLSRLDRDLSNEIETWSCGGATTFTETVAEVISAKPAIDFYSYFTLLYGIDLTATGPFTIFAPIDETFFETYNIKNFIELSFYTQPRSFVETINNHIVEGSFLSTDLYDGQILTSITGRELKVTVNEDGVFVNSAKITEADFESTNGVVHLINDILVAEPLLLTYPWLENAVNFFRCTDQRFTIYQSGDTQFIYVEEFGKGTLYTSYGDSFCTDRSGFSCIDAYRLSNPLNSWTCPNYVEPETPETPETPTTPNKSPIFETYNWLSNEVNAANCDNEKVTVYQSGAYDYLYIENANGGSLYTNFGLSFCTSAPGFSCVDAYRLSTITGSWTCEDEGVVNPPPIAGEADIPQELKGLEWLNDVIDFNNCNSSSIEVYDFGSYSFVYVTTNGTTTMYLNNGTYYCANTVSYNCKSLYSISRAADIVWNCRDANKSSTDQFETATQKTASSILSFLLYPNPTTDFVYLDILNNEDKIQQVNFYDMMGKVILTRTIPEEVPDQLRFNLKNQAKGLYLVEVITENTRTTQKLVVE